VNKLLKYFFLRHAKFLFLHFLFFIIFIFIFILDWAQPARPGHWPKLVTRRGPNQQEARVECLQILHACMYCAKVINLPSRSAIFLTKWGKEEKTKTDLPVRREAETRWRISGHSLLPPILFPSPSVSDPLISYSFSLLYILSLVLEMAKTVANLFFFFA